MVSCAPFDVGLCVNPVLKHFPPRLQFQMKLSTKKKDSSCGRTRQSALYRLIEKRTLKDFVIKRYINVSAINPQNEILKSLRVFMKSQKAVLLINDDCWWKSLQSFQFQHRVKINFSHLSEKGKERFKMKAQHVAALN